MTVKELIEELSYQNPDAKVVFSYPSGDYWKTDLAGEVITVEEGDVTHSDYHDHLKIADSDDEMDNNVSVAVVLAQQ